MEGNFFFQNPWKKVKEIFHREKILGKKLKRFSIEKSFAVLTVQSNFTKGIFILYFMINQWVNRHCISPGTMSMTVLERSEARM